MSPSPRIPRSPAAGPGTIMRCRGTLAQIALVVLGASLLASCSSGNGGKKSATDTSNKRVASAKFEPGPCPQTPAPVPGFHKASCGVLIVPEHRQSDNGRTIRLAVVRVPATVPHTPPLEPIVFLAGGPGNSALLDAHIVTDPGVEVQRDHEVIFMSARGTWGSTPFLTCPDVEDFERAFPGLRYSSDAARDGRVRAVRECHDRLVAQNQGIDLSAYNTTEAATDYAELRTALGIREWHVLGHSYGTYLAQELMRTHPDGIRSVFLEGITPPGRDSPEYWAWDSLNESLDNIFRACGEQPPCAARYPQLGVKLNELATKLEASPFRTTAKGPDGQPVDVVLDGGALMGALRRSAYNPADVPLIIDEAAKGNPQKLAQRWADTSAPPPPSARGTFSHGFHYSVLCSESIPYTTASAELTKSKQLFPGFPDSLLRSGPQFAFFRDVCGAWPVRKAPAAVRQPVKSSIRTLIMVGTFDPSTGARNGDDIKNSGISNSTRRADERRPPRRVRLRQAVRTARHKFLLQQPQRSRPQLRRQGEAGAVHGLPLRRRRGVTCAT